MHVRNFVKCIEFLSILVSNSQSDRHFMAVVRAFLRRGGRGNEMNYWALFKYMYFACDIACLLITKFQQFHLTILAVLTFVQSCQCLAYHLLWFAIYLKSGKNCIMKVRSKH